VTGVDINEEAVINARDNRALLGKDEGQLDFVRADLFPPGDAKYDLVVCNPPWIPMPAVDQTVPSHNVSTDGLMGGVLDRGGDLLPALFRGLAERLSSRGRLWLIYSDMSVKLGLQDEVSNADHHTNNNSQLTFSPSYSRGSSTCVMATASECALRPAYRRGFASDRKIPSTSSRRTKSSPSTTS
jgi:methylase of polypeptide subunit release factors